jgi:hypothetical protein
MRTCAFAVESLAGLTPLFDNPEQMADKMAKRVESEQAPLLSD